MNWKVGLLRLWFVAAGCWVLFILASAWQAMQTNLVREVPLVLVAAVGPPLILLAAARIIWWVVAGFRHT